MSWLTVAGLDAGYGKRQVLFDVALSMEASEITLVVGPNGSGKSTLLKALFGLCDVFQAKNLDLGGSDLTRLNRGARLSGGLAYIPQYRNVFDRLTVKENLAVAAGSRVRSSQKARNAIGDVVELMPELAPLLARRAGQLSGGERQLLAFALGLIIIPKLALVDEPLAGLDERMIRRIKDLIGYYHSEHSVAFLIVEHRFTKLTELADRCYGLRQGRSIVSLNAAEISDPGVFDAAMQRVFFE